MSTNIIELVTLIQVDKVIKLDFSVIKRGNNLDLIAIVIIYVN